MVPIPYLERLNSPKVAHPICTTDQGPTRSGLSTSPGTAWVMSPIPGIGFAPGLGSVGQQQGLQSHRLSALDLLGQFLRCGTNWRTSWWCLRGDPAILVGLVKHLAPSWLVLTHRVDIHATCIAIPESPQPPHVMTPQVQYNLGRVELVPEHDPFSASTPWSFMRSVTPRPWYTRMVITLSLLGEHSDVPPRSDRTTASNRPVRIGRFHRRTGGNLGDGRKPEAGFECSGLGKEGMAWVYSVIYRQSINKSINFQLYPTIDQQEWMMVTKGLSLNMIIGQTQGITFFGSSHKGNISCQKRVFHQSE